MVTKEEHINKQNSPNFYKNLVAIATKDVLVSHILFIFFPILFDNHTD